jgi:SNF2 family DNA or RNA helicase
VAGLKARHKIALSGTPVENRIEEIHSLLDVLNPGIFGSAASFRRKFGGGASAEVAAGDRRALGRLLRPFLLRRTREQVLVDLPERTEETRLLSMTDAERMKYESYRDGAKRFLETRGLNAKTRFEAFTWLLRLRQACSHPRTLDATTSERSAKEQELLDLLAEVRERGQQALVFSQFLPTLEALHEAAVEAGHRAFLFVGETAREERDSLVARFQAGEADVLFMSLRAGGVGLNLTSADVVVHFDPWWNPALESQATARAHRFGRKDTVHVVRLCYSDTVEERMLELHAMKKQLSEDLLGGKSVQDGFSVEEADAGLSLDDIRGLFDDT